MNQIDLARLETIARTASSGWRRWEVNPKHHQVSLEGFQGTILDFRRWGMGGAAPRFRVSGLMVETRNLAVEIPGREHHASWARQLLHPDAVFMEEITADVVLALIDRIRELEGR